MAGREREARRDAPTPKRVIASRPLICVAGETGDERSTRLATRLIEILCARGCTPAALIVAEGGVAARGAAETLRKAGAGHVALVLGSELPEAAQRALDAQPIDTVFVALGAALVDHLRVLLTIAVPDRAGARDALLDLVDLRVDGDPEGVATRIGDWIAQRVDQHALPGKSDGSR
jgi:hypothetical protein